MFPNLQEVASLLVAQAPPGGGCQDGGGNPMFLVVMMMAILYFVWFRPASKDRKQHQSMIDGLKRGDEIITSSGIIGSIADISERIITVEVARNVKIRILKTHITKRLEAADEKSDDKSKKKTATSKSKS